MAYFRRSRTAPRGLRPFLVLETRSLQAASSFRRKTSSPLLDKYVVRAKMIEMGNGGLLTAWDRDFCSTTTRPQPSPTFFVHRVPNPNTVADRFHFCTWRFALPLQVAPGDLLCQCMRRPVQLDPATDQRMVRCNDSMRAGCCGSPDACPRRHRFLVFARTANLSLSRVPADADSLWPQVAAYSSLCCIL